MGIKVTVLGCNSATPTVNKYPTAQLINVNEELILVDCGEGTQVQLRRFKIKFSKINHICITHLHGDHVFGLIGLVSTFALLGRKKELCVYGPKGIKRLIINQLRLTETFLSYHICFKELDSKDSELIFKNTKVSIQTIPLQHRIYCNGYLFKEAKKERKLNITAIQEYPEIDICDYQNIKNGKDYNLENGVVVSNEKLTFDPEIEKSYAFCSDTIYSPKIIPIIKNVDALYHEATFTNDLKKLALKTGHTTALEAGLIAKECETKHLIIGHFSNRYKNNNLLKLEAEQNFKPCSIAYEGFTFEV